MNEETEKVVRERLGISGIKLDEIEEIYNPVRTGLGTMTATRSYLIKKGMSSEFADSLAHQYI